MNDLLQESSDERVAILLRALGEPLSVQILSELPDERARDVRNAIQAFENDEPDADAIEDVLVDFERFLRFAQAGAAEPEEKTEIRIADTVAAPPPEPEQKPFQPTGDPIADLNQLRPFQIAKALAPEQPRTAALVMNQLAADTAAEVLPLLPDDKRSEVFLQMNRSESSPAVLVERIVRTTVVNALKFDDAESEELDADARAAALLRSLGKGPRKEMLEALQEQDAEMADRVRSLLYEFEDLLRLESRSIQKLLGEFDIDTLCTALNGAEQDIVERVNSNLSKRARSRLAEEMELAAPDEEAVEAARKEVTDAMGRLDQNGGLKMTS